VLVAAGNTHLFRLLLLVHVASAIVGFGALVGQSVAVARLRRFDGVEAYAVARANYAQVRVGEKFLYLLAVAGVAAVATSDGRIGFDEAWLMIAGGVYLATLAVLHGVIAPARRQLLVVLGGLAGEPVSGEAPQRVDLGPLGRRLSLGGALVDLLLVAALVLMIWQPGS
jgi:hypothetical protein